MKVRSHLLKITLAAWLAAWATVSVLHSDSSLLIVEQPPGVTPSQPHPLTVATRSIRQNKPTDLTATLNRSAAAPTKKTGLLVASPVVPESGASRLSVIIPCYSGHRKVEWRRLLASIFRNRHGTPCDFDLIRVHTIVSTVAEKHGFLETLNSTAWYRTNQDHSRMFSIHSLKETLELAQRHGLPWELTDANVEQWFRVTHNFGTRDRHWPAYKQGNISTSMSMGTNKHWLQSTKKLYGCAAFGGFGRRDQCMMLDADSYVKGSFPPRSSGLCATATAYMRHGRRVLVRPQRSFQEGGGYGKYTYVVELSRDLLSAALPAKGSAPLRGEAFGEFYALEVYHWIWSPKDVRDFLDDAMGGAMAKLALSHPSKYSGWFFSGGPFIEETMYHFLYPRRGEAGYRFSSISDVLRERVSEATHRSIIKRAGAFGSLGESLVTIFTEMVTNETEIKALQQLPEELGVSMCRCGGSPGREVFLKYISICTSD